MPVIIDPNTPPLERQVRNLLEAGLQLLLGELENGRLREVRLTEAHQHVTRQAEAHRQAAETAARTSGEHTAAREQAEAAYNMTRQECERLRVWATEEVGRLQAALDAAESALTVRTVEKDQARQECDQAIAEAARLRGELAAAQALAAQQTPPSSGG